MEESPHNAADRRSRRARARKLQVIFACLVVVAAVIGLVFFGIQRCGPNTAEGPTLGSSFLVAGCP